PCFFRHAPATPVSLPLSLPDALPICIPHFPVDPGWRIQARWEPFDPPRTLEYLTVLGTPDSGTVSGQTVFERGDETFTLWPMDTDRKSTRLNSSHVKISHAVFCLKIE